MSAVGLGSLFCCLLLVFVDVRALHMLGKHHTAKLYPLFLYHTKVMYGITNREAE